MILILGAGISGLTCGYRLKGSVILEKESFVGGLARTVNYKGFRFDLGGHRFLTDKPQVDRFVKELTGQDLLYVRRESLIYQDGRFLRYPPKLISLRQTGLGKIFLWGGSYALRKLKPLKGSSFSDKLINRFGDEIYKFYFRDYTEKIWGVPCEKLSADLAETRIPSVSLLKAGRQMFVEKDISRQLYSHFFYPKHGIGRICGKLAEESTIRLSNKATALAHDGKRINAVIINNSEELRCDTLISTIPITELAGMLNPPPDLRPRLDQLRYRSLCCVFMILKQDNLTNEHWIYFPGREIYGRLHEPKNWSPFMSGCPGKTGVCFEIFCDYNDIFWKSGDDALVEKIIEDTEFLKRDLIEDYCVVRIKDAYPVYKIGYEKSLKAVNEFLSKFENLYTVGRTGSYSYINMDDCIKAAWDLADILGK